MMDGDMKERKSEYLLRMALEEQLSGEEDLTRYDENTVPDHPFSSKHEKKMKKMMKRVWKKENASVYRKRIMQRAACIALFLTFSTCMVTQVDAFRIPVYNYFIEVKEKATRFGAEEVVSNTLSEEYLAYLPTYVAEGFEVERIQEGAGQFLIFYVDKNAERSYTFRFNEKILDIVIDTEDAILEEIEINGTPVQLIQKEGRVRVLMRKDGHQFFVFGQIQSDEAVAILESIK